MNLIKVSKKAVLALIFSCCHFAVCANAGDIPTNERSLCGNPMVKLDGREVVAVGDSILASVKPLLEFAMPGIYIDAKKSRQFKTGYQILKGLSFGGMIKSYTIVELGSNGAISPSELNDLIKDLSAKNTVIIFIKPYVPDSWQAQNSKLLYDTVEKYKENTFLVDWEEISKKYDDDVLMPDKVHLNQYGRYIYTAVIINSICRIKNADSQTSHIIR
jgi:hypothetical protein